MNGRVWRSAGGEQLEFDRETWQVEESSGDRLTLRRGDDIWLDVTAQRADRNSRMKSDEAPELPTWLHAPRRVELPIPHGPNVGYAPGAGAWYEGFVDSPQGPREAVTVATLAGARGGRGIVVDAVFFAPLTRLVGTDLRGKVDTILNSVTWGAAAPSTATGSGDADGPGPATEASVPPEGLRPGDVGKAYGLEPLWQRGVTGKGIAVAVVSLDSFRDADVADYDRRTGVTSPAVERVLVSGEPVTVGEGTLEVTLTST